MGERLSILIVDDEPIVGDRLKVNLERDGYQVSAFSDPERALQELDSAVFDIVVCDMMMGDVDGLQVLERVRKRSKRTKVIMITGYATLELARESLAKGAFDFIAKPFKLGELRKAIENAFASGAAAAQVGGP